jgi:hypothetical protein
MIWETLTPPGRSVDTLFYTDTDDSLLINRQDRSLNFRRTSIGVQVVAPVGSTVTFDLDGTPERNLEIAPSPSAYFGAEGDTAAVLLSFISEELLKIRLHHLGPGRYAIPPTNAVQH